MDENFCNKCGECCRKIKADFENDILYFNGIQPLDAEFKSMLNELSKEGSISICECTYLKDNLCTHPSKPQICTKYPDAPFAYIPDECGYSGFVFMNNEKIKQNVRKFKEDIIHINALISTTNSRKEKQQYEYIIKVKQQYIDKYKAYGSFDW